MIIKLLTIKAPFGVSKLNRRLQRLVRVYTCQNVKLFEISCSGSLIVLSDLKIIKYSFIMDQNSTETFSSQYTEEMIPFMCYPLTRYVCCNNNRRAVHL